MNNPSVSVIVPVYGVEEYLDRCLKSLVNQTLKSIQIIVVNDGSPDNSQSIIDMYVENYPDIVECYIKENGGLSSARNYGIPFAKGEYIGFVDSDDYCDVNMFEKLYEKASKEDADVAVCGYWGINEKTGSYKKFLKGKLEFYGTSLVDNPDLLCHSAPYAWNKLVRKSLFEKTGICFPDGQVFEDIPTMYSLFLSANKIVKVDESLYFYILQRDGAITATYKDNLLDLFKSLESLINYYKKNQMFENFYDQLCYLAIRHSVFRFRTFKNFENKLLQKKILNEGFALLNSYFPDWKNNEEAFKQIFKKSNKIKKLETSKSYWNRLIYTNKKLLKIVKKIIPLPKKIIRKLKKKNPYQKFLYLNYRKVCKILENQVLFESFHGTTINDSPFALLTELCKDSKFDIYLTSRKNLIKSHEELLEKKGIKNVKLVPLGSRKYQKILATSKYLVNNVSFPTYFIRRDEQAYLNTWHGTPLKTLGKSMVQGIQDMSNIQRNFLQATHLLYPNDFTMNHMVRDYNLTNLFSGKIILSGYPRNTVFFDDVQTNEIRTKYEMNGKEVFAYMPTWRGATSNSKSIVAYQKTLNNILELIDSSLSDSQIMYVNLHSLLKDKINISEYEHIKSFPPEYETYAFLNACDILISDYSSVFFDFSITRKPIALFMYDYEEYMAERSMYMDVRNLPFDLLYTNFDLVSYLGKENKNVKKNGYEEYEKMFLSYESEKNTIQLLNYFFYNKNQGIKIIDYENNKNTPHDIYYCPKLKTEKDVEKLDAVKDLKSPLVIFQRKDFNYILLKCLGEKYNSEFDYLVVDQNVLCSFWERFSLIFKNKKKNYPKKISEREAKRILPGIKVNSFKNESESRQGKSLESYFSK